MKRQVEQRVTCRRSLSSIVGALQKLQEANVPGDARVGLFTPPGAPIGGVDDPVEVIVQWEDFL